MGLSEHIVMRELDVPAINDFEVYRRHGGWEAYRMALKEKNPADIVAMVKESGLRGRGGAGFPTGIKWGFLPKGVYPRYLLCNCDESEPGTFNNHQIIDRNPHQLIEGVALSAFAIECHTAYIYMRGEFAAAAITLERAIAAAYRAGFLGKNILGTGFDLDIYVHRGAGAYICGEETALMESLEGKIGQPRLKPPFPAVAGLYGKPTIINNVETLANVPRIVEKGVAWYRSHGTEKSPGTKCFSLSGHVNRPGNYELPFGVPLRELIESPEYGGGMRGGREDHHPRRGLGPLADPRAPRCAPRLRERRRRRFDARLRGGDRPRRYGEGAPRGLQDGRVLQARVLWKMHSLPRGHPLAGQGAASHRRRGPRRARGYPDFA